MSKFDRKTLRSAFGSFITGVTVVTASDPHGKPVGFTANSYTSVSLEPPLLLVCPARGLSSFEVFWSCTHFAVSILAEGQQDVSNAFATSSLANSDRFDQIEWRIDTRGTPLIEGAAACFSCRSHSRMEAGDHLILIGEIESFESNNTAGLGFSNIGYFGLGLERRAETLDGTKSDSVVGAIIEHDGKVLLEHTDKGLRPPQIAVSGRGGALSSISDTFSEAGLEVEFGPVYSIYDDNRTGETFTYYRGAARSEATGNLGRYIALDDLSDQHFVTAPQRGMMTRYALERHNGVFGLYVGDERAGEIHLLGQGPSV